MKKKIILWILLAFLVVLITGYVIFYLTYDNKNGDSSVNEEKWFFENGEKWLFHTCNIFDDTDVVKTNPVELDSFTFNKNKVNICHKDGNCSELEYELVGEQLNIKKKDGNVMVFTLSFEEHYIVLSEYVDNMELKYYFIKYME